MAIWRQLPHGRAAGRDARRGRAAGLAAAARAADARRDPALQASSSSGVADLKAAGEPRTAWNPPSLHVRWAEAIEQRVADGTVERSVEAPVQAIRIGGVCITAWPCEPFCELGLEVKERSIGAVPGHARLLERPDRLRSDPRASTRSAAMSPWSPSATSARRRRSHPRRASCSSGTRSSSPRNCSEVMHLVDELKRGGSLVDSATEAIRSQIVLEKLAAGERLPPERVLVQELGVSRTVLREALSSLEALGLIETRGTRGRFVAQGGSSERSRTIVVGLASPPRARDPRGRRDPLGAGGAGDQLDVGVGCDRRGAGGDGDRAAPSARRSRRGRPGGRRRRRCRLPPAAQLLHGNGALRVLIEGLVDASRKAADAVYCCPRRRSGRSSSTPGSWMRSRSQTSRSPPSSPAST